MRITISRILAIASCALVTTAHAAPTAPASISPLSYTNVDVGVVDTELNNSSLKGNGLLLRSSLAIHKNAFLIAQLADVGYSHNIDGLLFGVGAGGHMPITNALDVVGTISLLHQHVDTRSSENGLAFTGTVRGFVVSGLEVEGGVKHVHFEDSGNDTSLIGEGRYFFTDRIAGGVLVQFGDTTSVGINARFVF